MLIRFILWQYFSMVFVALDQIICAYAEYVLTFVNYSCVQLAHYGGLFIVRRARWPSVVYREVLLASSGCWVFPWLCLHIWYQRCLSIWILFNEGLRTKTYAWLAVCRKFLVLTCCRRSKLFQKTIKVAWKYFLYWMDFSFFVRLM